MPSAPPRRGRSRQFWVLAVGLGLIVLLDLALFGWLLFRSLSKREVERILLETRHEAEDVAGRIAGSAERTGGDLFTAVALEQESQTYIDSVLKQRDIVQTVEIRDKNGTLVMRDRRETQVKLPSPAESNPEVSHAPKVEVKSAERQSNYIVPPPNVEAGGQIITVPIGEFGSLEIGISQTELERRVSVLRLELARQTSAVGAVTLVLLVAGFILISALLRRGRRLEEQAADAERLAYLGTLAAGLAHEIRNPLNSLSLNMQMLEEDLAQPATTATNRRLVAITRSEIARLEHMVSDFLAYARPRPLELAIVAPTQLLQRVREVLAAEFARHRARVEVVDESEGARVRVDIEQMQQLLINLVQNGLTATEDCGRAPSITLAARRQGPKLLLEVADNGVGMNDDVRSRIFDIFFSTRKGGTGLGLAIAERIARAHGASIAVASEVGSGSTIAVVLPVATGDPGAAAA
ncbi:MAG: ATP-binding protein [Thermoanaerobaculia bacterium]